MTSAVSMSVVLVRAIARSLGSLGQPQNAFLSALGVRPTTDTDAFVSSAAVERELRAVAETIGDPSLGLAIARESPIGMLGAFDYAVWASPTVRAALTRWSHYYTMLLHGVALIVEERPPLVRVATRFTRKARHGFVLEDLALGVIARRARDTVGDAWRVRAVRLAHAPAPRAPYDEFFGTTEVSFRQPLNCLELDPSVLDAPLRTADPTTVSLVDAHLQQKRPILRPVDPFLDRVRAAVLGSLTVESFGVPAVAKELGVSARTLQRQLQEHGTSHRQVTEDVQREVAIALLTRGDVSSAEIAYRLGFARAAAFVRAFRRWTGESPATYRNAHRRKR